MVELEPGIAPVNLMVDIGVDAADSEGDKMGDVTWTADGLKGAVLGLRVSSVSLAAFKATLFD